MSTYSDSVLCACGCGLPAPLAKQTYAKQGIVKGQPYRFRVGHNQRVQRTDGNYRQVYRPERGKGGVLYEHVVIAEAALGRPLPDGAEVHHVDENRQNNANRNLVICQDHSYHVLLHYRARIVRAGGNPNTEKFCGDCQRCKPLAAFNVRRGHVMSGRQSICRECSKVRDAAKRAKAKAA